jgi:hypothetical protein
MSRIRDRVEQLVVEGVSALLDGSALDDPEVRTLPSALGGVFEDLLGD